jgi:hypothetical protein
MSSAQVYSEERPAFANGKQTEMYKGMQEYVSMLLIMQ